jgi:putative aldouronate transport system permease protein
MTSITKADMKKKYPFSQKVARDWRRNKAIYFLAILGVAYYVIFHYLPIGGVLMAFERYKPLKGIWGSEWVGLKYFIQFFKGAYAWRIIRNTLLLNFYDLALGFPAPIIFALLLNEVTNTKFKRSVQTISYLPYFISQIVICGIILDFLSLNGLFNDILGFLGVERTNFMIFPQYFRTIYVFSGIWQFMGYGAIIYLAALSAVDVQLYDAAVIDGCNRFQRVIHVTIPGIMPTIIILLILRIGSMMNVGFEKIILLYNPAIYETSDVISSFVYRYGLLQGNFSYSTAVGLFNSLVNFTLLAATNAISKKLTDISLW